MTGLFIKIVNMSISAGWIVLAVILLRFLLKKAPRWVSPLLWIIVGLRLILPISVESVLSLIPSAETISPRIMYQQEPEIHTGIYILNSTVNPILSESLAPAPGDSANPLQIWIPMLAVIWLVGVTCMLIYMTGSYIILRRRMRTAILVDEINRPEKRNIRTYYSDKITSPFVLGLLRPRIYLPFSLKEQDMGYVLAHEQAHIARRDHWIKPLGFLLLSVYWFHPLLWVAYILLCRDIEFACDERVIKGLGREKRADYSQALLACSALRRRITACPLAFGEVSVKDRVKKVLNYKRPAFWIVAAAVLAVGVLAVCFLTDPVEISQRDDSSENDVTDNSWKWEVKKTDGKKMTLDDVRRLSQKGEGLSWSDFEGFNYYDIGSGLHIRVYEIDDLFLLLVGSTGMEPEDELLYVNLKAEDGRNTHVDIRTGDVEAYIQEHQVNPILKTYTFRSVSCEVEGTVSALSGMAELAGLEKEKLLLSSASEIVGIRIDSAEELDAFQKRFDDELTFAKLITEPAFYQRLYAEFEETSDEEAQNPLIILYIPHGNLINKYGVMSVQRYGDELTLLMERTDREDKDASLDGCIIGLKVTNGFIRDVSEINIQMKTWSETDGIVGNGEVTAVYTQQDSRNMGAPTVTLYEDGEFTFFFSLISSYFGYGKYKIEDDRLILRTNDGRFMYTFNMVEDTLIFNAEESSEALWFSELKDGAVLTEEK